MNKIDLGIVTNEPFPIGMAATNRIISYTKELGVSKLIKIYIAKPTEFDNVKLNKNDEGFFSNTHYKYVHGYTTWDKNKFFLTKIFIILKGYFLLFNMLKRDRPKSVIIVSNNLYLILATWFISKIVKFKFFQEKSEYPKPIQNNNNLFYSWLYNLRYKIFDGLIVMTNELKDFFHNYQKKIFHLPMSVDFENFDKLKKNPKIKYFAYCGGGNYSRDGVLNIIKSFIEICKINNYVNLFLIGPIKKSDIYFNSMKTLVENSKYNNRIKFLGKISSEKVPQFLKNSHCLIMAPQRDFISGGFPTKLGEYIATGNPVICTDVSEIPAYLNKNEIIYAKPNDGDSIFNAIKFVIENPEKAKKIGYNGYLKSKKVFNILTYSKDFIKFLNI
tara:strand:- start:419 stop:1579 length:1161 start_codon:yes stop_codon:yes gene_type:complete